MIDFDTAQRDPSDSTCPLPAYDPGVHIHSYGEGYKAMAETIDILLLIASYLPS